jgi:hypothetical protein
MELLSANSATIQSILQDEQGRLGPIKIRMGIYATMRRIINYQEGLFDSRNFGEDENYDYRYHIIFKTRNMPILLTTNINDTFNFGLMRIAKRIDDYQNYGSDWDFYHAEKIFIEVTQFSPPTGASYILLPKDLAIKKEVVNSANDALHEVKDHPERVAHYKKYETELNFENISFPVQADEMS